MHARTLGGHTAAGGFQVIETSLAVHVEEFSQKNANRAVEHGIQESKQP
jgi:hypothetical protein